MKVILILNKEVSENNRLTIEMFAQVINSTPEKAHLYIISMEGRLPVIDELYQKGYQGVTAYTTDPKTNLDVFAFSESC